MKLPNRAREFGRKSKMIPTSLDTWLQMIRTFWTLQSRVEESLKKHKLTLAQFDLLAMLSALGDDLSQQELADQLAVTKGNMVGLVNRLSRRGLAERVPSRQGRRVNRIRLTNAGRRLVATALPDHWQFVEAMMKPLRSRELRALRALLSTLERGNEARLRNASCADSGRSSALFPLV